MRTVVAVAALSLMMTTGALAQTKTVETRVEVDSTTGKTTTTSAVVVSTSEDITPRNNMIVLNPLKFLLFYNLSYFRAINNVITVGGGFQVPSLPDLTGWGINAEVRFHPSGKRMRGFYVAPNLAYNSFSSGMREVYNYSTQTTEMKETSATVASIGVLLG